VRYSVAPLLSLALLGVGCGGTDDDALRRDVTAGVLQRVDADEACVTALVADLSDHDVREYHQLMTEELDGDLIDIDEPGLLIDAAAQC
jgi:hypothetical protein